MTDNAPTADRRALLQHALHALDEIQSKYDAVELARTEPIAIIGLGCRFPGGVDSPESYWRLLREGRDAVRPMPAERWEQFVAMPEMGAAMGETPPHGGFLDGLDQFDPSFFGISPREALTMDPQQRLVLEVAWEALERAGQAPDRLAGSQTGVFIGITTCDYFQLARLGGPTQLDVYAATGNALNAAAGRLAFTLGLQGPSLAVDTACSSSLVAVHLACGSLRAGDCRMAIAGGVNVTLLPEAFLCFARWGMMAPDGRCKTFDAGADGFVRGEGCGLVVLKRLSDALADGDTVLALIRGSAVNQDGRSSGLTVPNGPAQQALLRRALVNAGVAPHEVSYVEAHGTGTALGDPIEVQALGAVLGEGRAADDAFALGSVKTNMGHLEAAAGIAGLIKVVLALQHAEIPPHLHLQTPNPRIAWESIPVVIPTENTPWRPRLGRRVAGVSGFGFSGTNAHVVLEEPPHVPPAAGGQRPLHLLTLSARSAEALREQARRCADHLASHPDLPPADVCYSVNTGRAHFGHRLAAVASDLDSLVERLVAYGGGAATAGLAVGQAGAGRPKVAFLFSGQGAQYAGMGRRLYRTQPIFRTVLDRCDAFLRAHLDEPLLAVLLAEAGSREAALLDRTAYTQPALFALECALASLWRAWGVEPAAVLGHSVGEYAAACVAGVIGLEDGLRLVAERARLMEALPAGGAMAAAFAPEARVARALAEHGRAGAVAIAAVNGPEHVVVSGEEAAMTAVLAKLAAEGIKARRLTVSHAFHSPLLEPMLGAFERAADGVAWAAPRLPLVSNVTGQPWRPGERPDAAYWRRQAREPVRFADGAAALHAAGCEVFVEIGPDATLLGMARHCLPAGVGAWLPSLRRGREDWETLLGSLAELYARGAPVDWAAYDGDVPRRRLSLPTYPFQRQRHWLDTVGRAAAPRPERRDERLAAGHPLLGQRVELAALPDTHIWQGQIDTERLPYLDDHRVQETPVLPATAFMEMVMAGAAEAFGAGAFALTEVEYQKALLLPAGARATVQVTIADRTGGEAAFRIDSRPAVGGAATDHATWTQHAHGCLRYHSTADGLGQPAAVDLEAIRQRCTEELSGDEFYRRLAAKGNQWGPTFQGTERLWRGDGEALSCIRAPEALADEVGSYLFHPAVSDASGHVLVALAPLDRSGDSKGGAFVGAGIEEVRLYRRPRGRELWAYARLRPEAEQDGNVLVGDVQVVDETGEVVTETRGARLWYLEGNERQALGDDPGRWFFDVRWRPAPRSTEPRPGAAPAGPPTWLILADEQGVSAALAECLAEQGARCIVARAGDAWRRLGDSTFEVRPDRPEDLRRLIDEALGAAPHHCRGVVHLWNLDAAGPDGLAPAALAYAQAFGCRTAAAAVRALAGVEWGSFPRLWLVTRGAQPVVDGDPPLAVAQAPVWGLGRSVAVEHTELWGGLVDLDPACPAAESAALLAAELSAPDREDQLAFRRGERHVARLTPQPIRADRTATIRAEATYLITGGLGGLGLRVAHWLVAQGARRLALIGRTALPPRVEWDHVAENSPIASRIAAVRDLESMGARVLVAAADVADEAALGAVLEQLRREDWPSIRGVVHAAGTLSHRPVAETDGDDLEAVMRPKATGGWLLHRALLEEPLDFFVCFSSASAVLSSPLLGGYAAANAFLDGLAHYRRSLGLPAVSINWGVWGEAGMTTQFGGDEVAMLALRGMGMIAPEQGLVALGRALAGPAAQVSVLPVDWRRWQELYPAFVEAPLLAEVVSPAKASPVTRRGIDRAALLAAAPDERSSLLGGYLREQAAEVLRMASAEVDPEQPLTMFGLDSLMAVELKNRIELDTGIVIPMVAFLQGPSTAELAGHLLSALAATSSDGATVVVGGRTEPDMQSPDAQLLARIDQLSNQEVEALLAELLAGEKPDED